MTWPRELTPDEIVSSLTHARVENIHVHPDDEGGIKWIAVKLDTGVVLAFQAHGMHTEGWLYVEEGTRVADIYGVTLGATT